MTEPFTTYQADIPAEPDGVTAVVDTEGYVWQKVTTREQGSHWTSRRKRQYLLGQGDARVTWRVLLVDYGPVTVITLPAASESRA